MHSMWSLCLLNFFNLLLKPPRIDLGGGLEVEKVEVRKVDVDVEMEVKKMKTLGGQIAQLLCDVLSYTAKRCNCEYPIPVRYDCVYGTCEIYRCHACNRVLRVHAGRCYFPYSYPPDP